VRIRDGSTSLADLEVTGVVGDDDQEVIGTMRDFVQEMSTNMCIHATSTANDLYVLGSVPLHFGVTDASLADDDMAGKVDSEAPIIPVPDELVQVMLG
jgi:hypothetical protein